MAQHWVKFTLPWRELGNPDTSFSVYRDSKKFGELRISRGAVVWYPRGKVRPRKLSWPSFDKVMKGARISGERRRQAIRPFC
jgi:hypothetical protein